MTLSKSGLEIRASEQTNLSLQLLLNDSMPGEQSNYETVINQREEGNDSLAGESRVEQEYAAELPIIVSSGEVGFTAETPSNFQQMDATLDKAIEISAESDLIFFGETNGEAPVHSDGQIAMYLDQSRFKNISLPAASKSNDTSFGKGSRSQSDTNHPLRVPGCHAKPGDKGACDSVGSHTPSSSVVQAAELIESDKSEQKPEPDFAGSITNEDTEEISQPDPAIITVNEDTEQIMKTNSTLLILDDNTEQTAKSRQNSLHNATKRSNDKLWMGRILAYIDEAMEWNEKNLVVMKKATKRGEAIRNRLIECQKYIRDGAGEESKVKEFLEQL